MMELFDFKAIAENKQGKKNADQIQDIKDLVNPVLWIWTTLGILLFGGLFYAFAASAGSNLLSLLGWILVPVGIFAALRGFTTWNLRRKLLTGSVQVETGTIEFHMPTAFDTARYTAKTNSGKLLAQSGMVGLSNYQLPPGTYCFYYLTQRNWLLSIEPLSSEAELRANLDRVLELVFSYDPTRLQELRQQAKSGAVQTVQGLPRLRYKDLSIYDDEYNEIEYFCKLEGHNFKISPTVFAAILSKFPHRAYFRAGQEELLALELVNP